MDVGKYALDSLLGCEDPYVHVFIEQLKFELNGYEVVKKMKCLKGDENEHQ